MATEKEREAQLLKTQAGRRFLTAFILTLAVLLPLFSSKAKQINNFESGRERER